MSSAAIVWPEAGPLASTPPPPRAFADALEFSGHRVLTDAQLDKLAEEIVAQIRRRGPFLSLSEFVNRQLTSASNEKDLALAAPCRPRSTPSLPAVPGDPANPFA